MTDKLISKEKYVEAELESMWDDHKFITQVMRDYFWKNIRKLTKAEWKQYLIDYGYIDE